MTLPINLLLVRHGQSEGNEAKRKSEKGDNSTFTPEFRLRHSASLRLTEHGRKQAECAGKWLREFLSSQSWGIDKYYTSGYLRAQETAGLLRLPGVRWRIEPYLSERDWGEMDQIPEQERNEKFSEALKKRRKEPFFWRPPNGESFLDLCGRVDRILDTLHRECNTENVIIVCHGEVMRAFQIRIERTSQEEFKRSILSHESADRIHNCQITRYSRINPETGELAPYPTWVQWIRPTDTPVTISPWRTIQRHTFTNEELLAKIEKASQ